MTDLSQQSREAHALRVSEVHRSGAARLLANSPIAGLSGTAGSTEPHWMPGSRKTSKYSHTPYVRVEALRSSRPVRVELGGVVLAESSSPVMVFETGLPTCGVPEVCLACELQR